MSNKQEKLLTITTMSGEKYDIFPPSKLIIDKDELVKRAVYDVTYRVGRRSMERITGRYIHNDSAVLTIEIEDKTRLTREIVVNDDGYPLRDKYGDFLTNKDKEPYYPKVAIPINNIISCKLVE